MKKLLVISLALGTWASAHAQAGVSLSLGINQPGVYGQINIGNLPAPALYAPQPVLVAPGAAVAAPLYLYVSDAERLDWRRYCGRYNACGRPVYFVREDWVRNRYAHEHPGWDRRAAMDRRHDERRDRHD